MFIVLCITAHMSQLRLSTDASFRAIACHCTSQITALSKGSVVALLIGHSLHAPMSAMLALPFLHAATDAEAAPLTLTWS